MTRAGYNPSAALGVLGTLANPNIGDGKADWLFAVHSEPTQIIEELSPACAADLCPSEGITALVARFVISRVRQ